MRKYIFALTVAWVSVFINISNTLAACAPPAVGGDMVLRFPAAQGVWAGSASHMTGNVINTDLTTGGILYYDTTDNALKLCDGDDWVTLGAGKDGDNDGGSATTLAALTDVNISGVTNGQTIIYNSLTQKWEPGNAASITTDTVAFLVNRNSTNQTVTDNANVAIIWTNKAYDTNESFDLSTGRFQPNIAGYYIFSASAYCIGATICELRLNRNGVMEFAGHAADTVPNLSGLLYLNGTTDYVDVTVQTIGGSNVISGTNRYTYFSGALISGGFGGGGSGAETLAGLTDVDVTGATAGQALVFNSTTNKWEPGTVSGGGSISGFAAKFNGAIPTTLQPIGNYTASYNAGGSFNPTSGVFTAPQAGLYAFDATSYIIATGGGSLDLWVYALKSGVATTICRSFRGTSPTGNYFHSCAGMLDLTAGDTVYVRVMNSAVSSSGEVYFSGALQGSGGGSEGGAGGSPAAAGATGNIQFKGADGNLAADAGITWNNTEKRLYLGSTAALSNLSVIGHSSFRQDDTGSGLGLVVERSADHSSPPRLGLSKSRGTQEAPAAVINGDQLGSINFQGYRGGAYTAYGSSSPASIVAQVTGTVTATSIPTSLILATTAQDDTHNTEHMRITPSGNIGIGTAAPRAKLDITGGGLVVGAMGANGSNSNSAVGLHVHETGYIWASHNGTGGVIYLQQQASGSAVLASFLSKTVPVGAISTNGTGTAYNTTSDARLKENVTQSERGLDTLMRIDVQDFNFISDPAKTRVQGFIAQQLNTIYPEAVTVGGESMDEPWNVDYGRLTPLIVQSIQDLKTKNDALEQQLGQMQQNMEAMQAVIEKLQEASE